LDYHENSLNVIPLFATQEDEPMLTVSDLTWDEVLEHVDGFVRELLARNHGDTIQLTPNRIRFYFKNKGIKVSPIHFSLIYYVIEYLASKYHYKVERKRVQRRGWRIRLYLDLPLPAD